MRKLIFPFLLMLIRKQIKIVAGYICPVIDKNYG